MDNASHGCHASDRRQSFLAERAVQPGSSVRKGTRNKRFRNSRDRAAPCLLIPARRTPAHGSVQFTTILVWQIKTCLHFVFPLATEAPLLITEIFHPLPDASADIEPEFPITPSVVPANFFHLHIVANLNRWAYGRLWIVG